MTASKRERVKEAVVKSLAMGASVLAACAGVQIGRSTFYRWLEGDATFEEAVIMARVGLIEEVMGELRLLAFGRYVEEEKIVETASGPRKEWRKRWRDGKVSALMAMIKMMEKDLAGMEERRRKMTNDPMTNDQGGRGDLGLSVGVSRVSRFEGKMGDEGMDRVDREDGRDGQDGQERRNAVSVGESRVSRFEAEMGDEARGGGEAEWVAAGAGASHIEELGEEVCGGGLAGRVAAGAGASHIEEQGEEARLGVSRLSQNTLKNGGGEAVRETRRERRAREREEFKAAKKAAKRQQ